MFYLSSGCLEGLVDGLSELLLYDLSIVLYINGVVNVLAN